MKPEEYDELYERVYAPVYDWTSEERDDYEEHERRITERITKQKRSRMNAIASRRREFHSV